MTLPGGFWPERADQTMKVTIHRSQDSPLDRRESWPDAEEVAVLPEEERIDVHYPVGVDDHTDRVPLDDVEQISIYD